MNEEKKYAIIPASASTFIFLCFLGILLMAILVTVFVISDHQPAGIAITLVVTLGLLILFVFIGYQATHAVFTLNDRGLKLGPGLYGRFIPREKITTAGVKVLDLKLEKGYQPLWRMNGAGLPGYGAGWFKLRNKKKALLFLTNYSSVVYIPTTDKYSVMLSVREADEMADLIRRWDQRG
ncbi:MAG: hypothetical protein JXA17_07270 [Dehalococcoidales bacterium]|nr:hypothetical protein [Dehalococcoidales bacterium]